MLTMKIGRPVKYLQSRNEETTVTAARGSCTYKWKIGAKKDGSLTAIKVDCVRDVGGYGTLAMPLAVAVVDYVAIKLERAPGFHRFNDIRAVFNASGR